MPLRILSWNVNGLRAIQQRRKEPLSEILRKLGADIICLQETKLSKKDIETISQLANVPGWQSYFGLGRLRSGYAGLVTFCREETVPVFAASEGLAETGAAGVSDPIHLPPAYDWARLPQEHMQHNDKEGRAVITDHGQFVLIHLYAPAVTNIQAERFPRKLTFYEALELRVNTLVSQGRAVIIAGDLNIARDPVDNCDWADSKLPPEELLPAFLSDRPDRRWFLNFLNSRREGAPVDVFRRFHPNRRRAYTVWSAGNKRQRYFGSRVDYILMADAESSSRPLVAGEGAKSLEDNYSRAGKASRKDSSSLLSKVTACDILSEWEGSDHAPVFAELDIVLQKLVEGAVSPKMESRQRFQGLSGGQRQLTSFFLESSLGKRNREDKETPPRPSLGEELAKARQ